MYGYGGAGGRGGVLVLGSEIVLVLSFLYSGREAGLIYHSNITHNSTLLYYPVLYCTCTGRTVDYLGGALFY
jgi:hypothetical protein